MTSWSPRLERGFGKGPRVRNFERWYYSGSRMGSDRDAASTMRWMLPAASLEESHSRTIVVALLHYCSRSSAKWSQRHRAYGLWPSSSARGLGFAANGVNHGQPMAPLWISLLR